MSNIEGRDTEKQALEIKYFKKRTVELTPAVRMLTQHDIYRVRTYRTESLLPKALLQYCFLTGRGVASLGRFSPKLLRLGKAWRSGWRSGKLGS